MPITDALGIAVLGISVVMLVLAALALLISGFSKLMKRNEPPAPAVAAAPAPVAAPAAAPAVAAGPAPSGQMKPLPETESQGELKLINVDDQTAAMIMAIVADELKTPLNRLRFLSIREII